MANRHTGSPGLVILTQHEMRHRNALVHAGDPASSAGAQVGWPAQPPWARFVVERYDKGSGTWRWDSFQPTEKNAKAAMDRIRRMGEKAKHRALVHRKPKVERRAGPAHPVQGRGPSHRFLTAGAAALAAVRSTSGCAPASGSEDATIVPQLREELRRLRARLGCPAGAMPQNASKLRELIEVARVRLGAKAP